MIYLSANGTQAQNAAPPETLSLHDLSDLRSLMGGASSLRRDLLVMLEPGAEKGFVRTVEQVVAFLNFFSRSAKALKEAMEPCNAMLLPTQEAHVHFNLSEFARMNAGGKLIRGVLAELGCHLFSDDEAKDSSALALAFELFQTAILIHDDIIDRATLRRNKPTIPMAYVEHWSRPGKEIYPDEMLRTANSLALCAGDVGFFLAQQMLVHAYGDDRQLARLLDCFNTVALRTMQGEIIDVALPFEEQHGLSPKLDLYESIIEIYRSKTAWYTVVGPMRAGAILAEGDEESLKTLEDFCENLGIAFQIQDDIMGVFGEEAALGKSVGSDVSEFKQTLFYYFMCQNEDARRQLLRYYGKELSLEELQQFRKLLQTSGALACVTGEMDRYFDRALKILEEIRFLPDSKKELLYGLVFFLRYRET